MKRLHLLGIALTMALLSSPASRATAETLTTTHILHGNTFCDHVIRLVHLHGVNNSVDRCSSGSMFHPSPFGSAVIPTTEFGDLQIMQVTQVPIDDPACGPRFAIVVQNASTRKVCDFHVSAVAIFGNIHPSSPNATVKVAGINPGEALEVMVQLPIEAFSMGNRNGQVIGFQRLVVAIDSFDELMETNEANNLQAFNSHEIPVATVVVGEVQSSVEVAPEAVSQTMVPQAAAVPAGQAAPAVAAPAMEGSLDASANVDALREAMQKLDVATVE